MAARHVLIVIILIRIWFIVSFFHYVSIISCVQTSPADGRVLYCGVVDNGTLEQVKGVTYSLVGFLGPLESLLHQPPQSASACVDDTYDWRHLLCNPANKLYHCIIYLAPGDYHRFHSAADWNVYARRHFPG